MDCSVITAPGLEQITAGELRKLDLLSSTDNTGDTALPFQGGLDSLYYANLHLRTATRILVRAGMAFMARDFGRLLDRATRLPWERFLLPGRPVTLHVDSRGSKLYHEEAIAERILLAIEARMGRPSPRKKMSDSAKTALQGAEISLPVVETPAQFIYVTAVEDRFTVNLDSSGEPLHRRGYRLATAKAPLREDLAAATLAASEWDGRSPLIDPFCGAGTIPIEAALMACDAAPGLFRDHFAFMDWPGFDRDLWNRLCAKAREMQASPHKIPTILASDRDEGAVKIASENAGRAGVSSFIRFERRAVSSISADASHGTGWIVTNPPFGLRVSKGHDLRNLYARFGNILKKDFPGWHVAILSSSPALLGHTGLKLDHSMSFTHGGLRVRLGRGVVSER